MQRLGETELDVVIGIRPKGVNPEAYRMLHQDYMQFFVSPMHPWATASAAIEDTIHEQQFFVYARGTETHRLGMEWIESRRGQLKTPIVLGDMQAVREMVKLGLGVGLMAPWVASREINDGELCLIPMPDGGISREWGAFHSPKKTLSLVEDVFIGLCGLAFDVID